MLMLMLSQFRRLIGNVWTKHVAAVYGSGAMMSIQCILIDAPRHWNNASLDIFPCKRPFWLVMHWKLLQELFANCHRAQARLVSNSPLGVRDHPRTFYMAHYCLVWLHASQRRDMLAMLKRAVNVQVHPVFICFFFAFFVSRYC